MFPNPRNSAFAMRDATRLAAVSALLAPAAVFMFDLPLMKSPAAFAAAGLFVSSVWWNRLVTLPYWLYVRSIDRVSFQRFVFLATGACIAIIFRYGEAVTGDFVSISLLSIAAVIAVRTTWLLIRSRSARTVRIAPRLHPANSPFSMEARARRSMRITVCPSSALPLTSCASELMGDVLAHFTRSHRRSFMRSELRWFRR